MKKILAFVLMAAILVCPVFASGEASAEAEAAEATTAATSTTGTTSGPTESATTIAAAAAASAAAAEEAEEVDDHAHNFVIVESTDPTCVDEGTVTMECSECGLTYSYEIPATGEHSYVASTKEATCTEEGLITYTCSVCGDTYTEVLPTTEHTPSAEEATCTEAVVCTVCGTELIPATGHSYTYQYDAVIAEDGTYESYGTWVCDNCGDVLDATEGNAIYYYGLLEGDDAASDAASDEAAEAEAVEISDPNNSLWYTIEIIMVIILVAELAIIMLSFGKKKKD